MSFADIYVMLMFARACESMKDDAMCIDSGDFPFISRRECISRGHTAGTPYNLYLGW